MNLSPFTPLSKTYLLAADSTAPTGIQPVVFSGLGTPQVHVVSTGNQISYLAYAPTAAAAQAAAVIPTAGTPQNVIPILPNSAAVYSVPVGSFFSAITAAAGPVNLMLTLGEGE